MHGLHRKAPLTHVYGQVYLELVDEVCLCVGEVEHVAPAHAAGCERCGVKERECVRGTRSCSRQRMSCGCEKGGEGGERWGGGALRGGEFVNAALGGFRIGEK